MTDFLNIFLKKLIKNDFYKSDFTIGKKTFT